MTHITLNCISINKKRSGDTYSFSAKLYIDNKLALIVSNDGDGGSNMYFATRTHVDLCDMLQMLRWEFKDFDLWIEEQIYEYDEKHDKLKSQRQRG